MSIFLYFVPGIIAAGGVLAYLFQTCRRCKSSANHVYHSIYHWGHDYASSNLRCISRLYANYEQSR